MLAELELKGVRLSINGDGLSVGTDSKLTDLQRQYIINNKAQIIAELEARDGMELPPADRGGSNLARPEDRSFVRQCLTAISGPKRLDIVPKSLPPWRLGVEAEPVAIKKDNAGRYRANIWVRKEKFN